MLELLFAASQLLAPARPIQAAAAVRAAAAISAHTRYLSDDLLEGRAPGSTGSELAMRYVSAEFERLGLAPLGPNYVHRFDMVGLRSSATSAPVVTGARGSLTLKPGVDSIVAAGRQRSDEKISDAELVFAGYGITAPEFGWDDFKDVDVRGKVLVVLNNDPERDPKRFGGKARLYYGRWTYKYEEAERRGALGVIIIHTTPSAGYPWQVVQTSWGTEKFELPEPEGAKRLATRMWATEDASRAILATAGADLDALRARAEEPSFRAVSLGAKISLTLKTSLRKISTGNVLGVLKGRDPKLASEYVVMTAHHDHLGRGQAKDGPSGKDDIYNGALDNASGVAEMLAIAETFTSTSRPAPRRSILFAAVGAEESGLLGSEYLCQHPPVPTTQLVANINIDGINIWGKTRDVAFIGLGKSTLDAFVIAAARAQGRTVGPDPMPDRGHFYRSDQFNFARVGVPAIYLDNGFDFVGRPANWGKERNEEYERTRYHQPSDQIESAWPWNLDGAVDDAELLSVVARKIADAPARPTWNIGDEFAPPPKK